MPDGLTPRLHAVWSSSVHALAYIRICADGGDVTPTDVPSFEYDASCACSVNQCDIVGYYDAYALVLAHDFDYGFPCFTINVVGGFVKHEHIGTAVIAQATCNRFVSPPESVS